MKRVALPSILGLIILLVAFSGPAAADVAVHIRGMDEDPAALANVSASLALPPGLVENGKVNKPWLERFSNQAVDKTKAALEPFGYYRAQVEVKVDSTGTDEYSVTVTIHPGDPVRVSSVSLRMEGPGAREAELVSLASSFPLKKGDVFRQDRYEQAKGGLKAKAIQLGYLDADFPVHTALVSVERLSADIDLVISTGQRYRFDGTTFDGAEGYPEKFLKRYLAFKPGEIVSFEKIGKTQLNFMNSDRFTDVVVTPDKEHANGLEVPVKIRLKSLPPKRLRIGVGYGTDTGPRMILTYKHVNMFHAGHELNADIRLSSRLQGIAAGYVIPDDRNIDSLTSLLVKLQQEDVITYNSQILSVEADRTRGIPAGGLGTLFFKVQEERYSVTEEKKNSRLLMPGFRLSWRKFDSLIRPTKAHRYEIEVEGTHKSIGSSISLVRVVTEVHLVFPLPWRLTFLTRAKAGATFMNEGLDELPASLRFFAGGDRSVRGYEYQALGPRNDKGEVIGGKHVIVGSVEMEKAILSDWGVAVFYDAGNAFNSLNDISLVQGAGIGIRYYTKIGAVRLDIARQIGVEKPTFHFHVTFGFQL